MLNLIVTRVYRSFCMSQGIHWSSARRLPVRQVRIWDVGGYHR